MAVFAGMGKIIRNVDKLANGVLQSFCIAEERLVMFRTILSASRSGKQLSATLTIKDSENESGDKSYGLV